MSDFFVCAASGAKFGSLSGFDGHRIGRMTDVPPSYGRSCLTADNLAAKGFSNRSGAWRMPVSPAHLERLAALRGGRRDRIGDAEATA